MAIEMIKVLLINGSPNEFGCTYTALKEAADTLNKNAIETEIFHIGSEPIQGCTDCRSCAKLGKCVFDDIANEAAEKFAASDAIIIGTPVYYGNAAGSLLSLMDRMFFSSSGRFKGKLGAAVVSARRGGCSTAFDNINKFFLMNHIHVVSSQYWNQVHGAKPEEVLQDSEGLQTMRALAENMAWLLRCIEAGKANGVTEPEYEKRIFTNFIR